MALDVNDNINEALGSFSIMNEYSANITCILSSLTLKALVLQINVSNRTEHLSNTLLQTCANSFLPKNSEVKVRSIYFPIYHTNIAITL